MPDFHAHAPGAGLGEELEMFRDTVRRFAVEQIAPLVESDPHVQRLTGLETWFALPGAEPIVPPPRWKQALLSWVGGYPTATAFFLVAGAYVKELPLLLRTLILSSFLILTLTYVVMPRLTALSRRWLYPPH